MSKPKKALKFLGALSVVSAAGAGLAILAKKAEEDKDELAAPKSEEKKETK